MPLDSGRIERIITAAKAEGRSVLLESEGMEILRFAGLHVPKQRIIAAGDEVKEPLIEGARVVVKVLSREILHKSDCGGVALVPNTARAINEAVQVMNARFRGRRLEGYILAECVEFRPQLGHELLLGMRWSREYGVVISLGFGGIYTEFINSNMLPGRSVAVFSAEGLEKALVEKELERLALTPLITGGLRGQAAMTSIEDLTQIVCRFAELSRFLALHSVSEFEVNPLVLSEGRIVPLDALGRMSEKGEAEQPLARPLAKIKKLLEPERIALIGVSQKMNPGRVILNNLLRDGYPKERIFIIKPGLDVMEGCACVPDLRSLPVEVDLLVVAVSAGNVPELVNQVIETKRVHSLLVIPAGFEEKQGGAEIVTGMHRAIRKSRSSAWQGPVINGGNCVGIRSVPGGYDSIFIPEYKLPLPHGESSPVALIAQSGAFTVARASWLSRSLNPRYLISIGNQMDLSIADYLEYLKDDTAIETFAVYVEGFKPGDGLRFIRAAREITAAGRKVILYAAGRTAAGSAAMASHTASVAGDYTITRELSRQAGVLLAESSSDFDDLLNLCVCLRGRELKGLRLGAMSNAGFDCVAIGDNLGRFRLAEYSAEHKAALQKLFETSGLHEILDVHNPLDVSPQAGDALFAEAARIIVSDPAVDLALIADVPITPALNTLPPGEGHREDFTHPESLPARMLELFRNSEKPCVAVLDGGRLYDPLCHWLRDNGVPVFRSVAQALRVLNLWR